MYAPILGVKNSVVGLCESENTSRPPAGPSTIDQVPEVPAVALRTTDDIPHNEEDISEPAKDEKQGLFELLNFTKIGLSINAPQLELESIPCEIGVVKLVFDTAPVPEILPFKEMLELQPALNNVAQSVVNFTLKTKLANKVLGSVGRGIVPMFHMIEFVFLS